MKRQRHSSLQSSQYHTTLQVTLGQQMHIGATGHHSALNSTRAKSLEEVCAHTDSHLKSIILRAKNLASVWVRKKLKTGTYLNEKHHYILLRVSGLQCHLFPSTQLLKMLLLFYLPVFNNKLHF